MLGIYHGMLPEHNVIADPELVLPTVIGHYIPTGIKGLLIAGLMAAAMSTFDSPLTPEQHIGSRTCTKHICGQRLAKKI